MSYVTFILKTSLFLPFLLVDKCSKYKKMYNLQVSLHRLNKEKLVTFILGKNISAYNK